MTLTEFLLERIAEDEAAASPKLSEIQQVGPGAGYLPPGSSYSPRMLAECEAKRRLVDWSAPVSGHERVPTDRPGVYDRREVRYVSDDGEDVLRIIALPYADHPDYREEWRP